MDVRVLEIQEALISNGFNPGVCDGIYGAKTEAAYAKWYSENECKWILDPSHDPARQPLWLQMALCEVGTREIQGTKNNPIIVSWLHQISNKVFADEIPWCAAFIGSILEDAGLDSTGSLAARSYTKWGIGLHSPAVGAIVVFWRGNRHGWKGHVGIIVGKTIDGKLAVLGGNQGDAVSIRAYSDHRVLAYRYPAGQRLPTQGFNALPIVPITSTLKSES